MSHDVQSRSAARGIGDRQWSIAAGLRSRIRYSQSIRCLHSVRVARVARAAYSTLERRFTSDR